MDFNSGNVIGQKPLFSIPCGCNYEKQKNQHNTVQQPMVTYVKDNIPVTQFNAPPHKPGDGILFRIVGDLCPGVDKKTTKDFNKYLEENSFTGKNIHPINEFDLYISGNNYQPFYSQLRPAPTFYAGDVEPDDYSQYINSDDFKEIIRNAIANFETKIAQRTVTSKDFNNAKNAYRTFLNVVGSGDNDLTSRFYQLRPQESLKINKQINELKTIYSSIIAKQQKEIERLSKLIEKNNSNNTQNIETKEVKENNKQDYNSVIFYN